MEIVNANLGGTKANYYVEERYDYKVTSDTRDGLLRGELTATYTHNGQDSAWPGGPYTNYVRVLTQTGTKLTGAKITYVKTNTTVDIFEDVIIDEVENYVSYETSFILQPQEEVILVLTYDLSANLSLTDHNNSYSLYWQKQSGTKADPYNFIFDYPFGMQVKTNSPGLNVNNDLISLEGVLNNDLDIFVTLQ